MPSKSAKPPAISVYYDGACGLCAREIAYYQRIAPQGAFDWRNLALEPDALAARGISKADALRSLHATDSEGRLHEGVGAFLLIWRRLGGFWRLPAGLISAPGIRWVANRAYRAFAAWRFQRLDHCQLAAAEERAGAKG